MRRIGTALLAAMLTLAFSAPAMAASDPQVEYEPIVRMFSPDGTPSGETIGISRLLRTDGRLQAKATATGLAPGGIYTFWWVVIPDGGAFPDDAFVALGDSAIVGQNGRATASLAGSYGQESITGFLIPFQPLTFNLHTAEVHVEIAYHGQASDSGGALRAWMSDFWTGSACPQAFGLNPGGTAGDVNAIGQPHCPVDIAVIYD